MLVEDSVVRNIGSVKGMITAYSFAWLIENSRHHTLSRDRLIGVVIVVSVVVIHSSTNNIGKCSDGS